MHMSIVVFSSKSSSRKWIVQRLTGSKATLISALKNLKHDEGGTYMVPAVRNAKSVLSSGHAGVPKVLLMLTDGRPSDRPASEFQSAKAAGIKVMMVLVGKNIRRSTAQVSVPCKFSGSSTDPFAMFPRQSRQIRAVLLHVPPRAKASLHDAGQCHAENNPHSCMQKELINAMHGCIK
jgi:hypothetical protein